MTEMEDKRFIKDYFAQMEQCLQLTPEFEKQLIDMKDKWVETSKRGGKVIFLGNGGSAGIASHLAIDVAKNGGIRATTFSDAALITCLANDYGFEEWMRHAVRIYAKPEDTIVAISCSGKSKNLLGGVEQAKEMGLDVITLTGMAPANPLKQMGDLNLWLDSYAYNIIETVHQFWCMTALDMSIGKSEYSAQNVTQLRS